jgi:hypothetical protein
VAELAQLDTVQMTRDPDGAGPQTSGYDLDFKEPVIIQASTEDLTGQPLREERCVRVRCQIEDKVMEGIRQVLGGTSPDSAITMVFHFKDLEDAGMVDDDGKATIRVNDRLAKILDCDENVIEEIIDPPGLFVLSATSAGFGLGRHRNLLVVDFGERELGVQSPSR